MGKKRVFTHLNLLSLFLIFILAIISIHIILSDSFVTGQQRDSLLSYLPENFRVLFVNNQSSLLTNADQSSQVSIESALLQIKTETLAVNVLEDLPRGSTRIEDIDNQSKADMLINNTELKQIENIIANKRSGINQI